MSAALKVFIYLLSFGAGFIVQYFSRLSPWVNLALSYLLVFILPPMWSLGLVGGIWISCAYFTYNPDLDRLELLKGLSWYKVLLSSLWTFTGFLLTLSLVWKLKVTGFEVASQREIIAWTFLVLIEVCLYRVIARLSPALHRIPLGYGIALFNFLMLTFWLYELGIPVMIMALVTLLIINPLLLIVIDLPVGASGDPYLRRNG
ncbi:MAG: hypothetical protein GXY86_09290 [Firmicutes bacterium]|nr:hypothetical protein [Bacillota bacterium]